MPRPFASLESSAERPHLTGPQQAAVAKLAYAAGRPDTIALLCGPAGVGKTTVLRVAATEGLPQPHAAGCGKSPSWPFSTKSTAGNAKGFLDRQPPHAAAVELNHGLLARVVSWSDVRGDRGALPFSRGQAVDGAEDPVLGVLFVDDAHRASTPELAEAVDRWRHRHEGIAIVLAGEGRLLTLVAGDPRLEQSVRLRATLPPFTLAETRQLLAPALPDDGGNDSEDVIRTIHEIAGGVPAVAMRLAEMVAMLAAAAPEQALVADHVETIHRRLCLGAA